MGDRKPIGVAYRDQDIDGGGGSLSEAVQITYPIIHNRAD
jgi:hypothetical protein